MFLGALLLQAAQPDFAREVRPLLAERCFPCHGPDAAAREAGLRLDTREGATADLGGSAAVVPGDPEASEAWQRVTSEFDFEVMPPSDSHIEPLDPDERALLRDWIAAGAPWAEHWAFVPPRKAPLPADAGHPVDALVERVLAERGLALSPPAPARTLARRLRFDLTGLPPTAEEASAAAEAADLLPWIDQLLASDAHAERMAMWWLDAARYADTDGFQQDATRQNWPWRDWVVDAFRTNMPYDRFTELQFAGDLIEGAGDAGVLATCFHRNHMHNGEGGRDPEESRVDYVRDRVNTVGAVWMGLTLECAQCHDHKFDPISQADYYALTAFFDSIDESGHAGGGAGPFLDWTPALDDGPLERARAERAAAAAARDAARDAQRGPFGAWLAGAHGTDPAGVGFQPRTPLAVASVEGSAHHVDGTGAVVRAAGASSQEELELLLDPGALSRVTGVELTVEPGPDGRYSDAEDGHFVLTGAKLMVAGGAGSPPRWASATAEAEGTGEGEDELIGRASGALDDDPRIGWSLRGTDHEGPVRIRLALEEPLPVAAGERLELRLLFRSNAPGAYARRLRVALCQEPGDAVRELGPTPLQALVELRRDDPAAAPDAALEQRLFEQFLEGAPSFVAARARVRGLERRVRAEESARGPQRVTVLRERAERRTTAVLRRGLWDQRGDEVRRATPASLGAGPLGADASRLDLARWLTSPGHPLTARVLVNQVWQLLMGRGLVASPEDLGTQCEAPVHRGLLDWLAADLMEHGWDLRRLMRLIVTSRVYRQSSRVSPELLALDPENELLARAPRFRLPSWMIRDAALAASGLLDPAVGGPPVFPHQPPGVWEEMFMGRMRYRPTVGSARHRRSLYAFWRRNVTPTFFFDSADRRTCSVTRRLTNTPLQALTLLNDATYAEAARALAAAALDVEGTGDGERLAWMAERVLGRRPAREELDVLTGSLDALRARYGADADAARAASAPSPLDAVPRPSPHDPAELAAHAAVAAVLLNLDEAITRE